jgi:hypothetical protein
VVGHLHHRRLQQPMLRSAAVGFLALILVLVCSTTVLADPPPPGTGASCPDGVCGVGAVDPGAAGSPGAGLVAGGGGTSPGHDSNTASADDGGGTGTGGGSVSAPACSEQPMSPQPAEGTAWWDGHSAAEGSVMQWVCTGGMTAATCTYCTVLTPHFVANGAVAGGGAPPPPPPPTPEELAQQAYQLLSMPDPSMNFGPDPERIAVRYWLYLWVDDPGVVSATVTAGAVSVTATATMTSVVWTMGEPVSADNLDSRSAPITCEGSGTNPGPAVDTTVEPAEGLCAYMFQVRSTPERTGGSGTWAVTATANWTITWAANTGESGSLAAPPRVSTTQVSVGAWSTVMVADGVSVSGG